MIGLLSRYTKWLHTRWPAGKVEKLPEVREDGTTAVPGLRVVGDLTGIPLLKFASDSGARAVQAILTEGDFQARRGKDPGVLDVAIVGGGVSGMSAAIEARRAGLRYAVYEGSEPFSTLVNFPKRKPIFTYPTEMRPAGGLQFRAQIKEALVEEMAQQVEAAGVEVTPSRIERVQRQGGELVLHHAGGATTRALRVVVAIGRSGNFRKLGVPGEELDKVYNRLHDPKSFAGQKVLVVGGGDSAVEAAVALARCGGAEVTLSHRGADLSRPKPENVEKLRALERDPRADVMIEQPTSERQTTAMPLPDPEEMPAGVGSVRVALGTKLREIRAGEVVLEGEQGSEVVPNDVVFAMIGREPPLDFFRRSGVPIRGEWRAKTAAAFAAFLAFCVFLYHWKAGGALTRVFQERGWFPFNLGLGTSAAETLHGTLLISLRQPGFYYSLAYCACVIGFGIARIRRRRTPYVTAQTLTLMAVQTVPLFLLPYLVLPWLGHNGFFESGSAGWLADHLFPRADYDPHGREYWRAFGLVLAWPLFIWNFFTSQPMWLWLVIGAVQSFVLIPLLVWRWGKGAYCGWLCSCGALAETLGDTHRQKMPHGPKWNRLNMVGQAILAAALVLMLLRIASWIAPGGLAQQIYDGAHYGWFLSYYYVVDLWLAEIVGVGFYFWFSGRVWCRFACPLAALMHVYARFSRFRIFAEKEKCISCNVCTSVCHQGIDIMNFANKGLPMEDPECVRCSACVQSCPTGVLSFGRLGAGGVALRDPLEASPVRLRERPVQN